MGTASSLISQAYVLAGVPTLDTTYGLNWLQNFLDQEYRRKYPWQRVTVTLPLVSGTASYPSAWNSAFLDVYQQEDGSVGRYTKDNVNVPMWGMTYRAYMALRDRATASGPPKSIIADPIGATWYVYPIPDASLTATVDIYTLPAALALTDTPLWSTYAPDAILVQAIKVAALDYWDDARYAAEKSILYGDLKQQIPGMLPTYRRRVMAAEGTTLQTAVDPRIFQSMAGWE